MHHVRRQALYDRSFSTTCNKTTLWEWSVVGSAILVGTVLPNAGTSKLGYQGSNGALRHVNTCAIWANLCHLHTLSMTSPLNSYILTHLTLPHIGPLYSRHLCHLRTHAHSLIIFLPIDYMQRHMIVNPRIHIRLSTRVSDQWGRGRFANTKTLDRQNDTYMYLHSVTIYKTSI